LLLNRKEKAKKNLLLLFWLVTYECVQKLRFGCWKLSYS
jgi:hypothetical protein